MKRNLLLPTTVFMCFITFSVFAQESQPVRDFVISDKENNSQKTEAIAVEQAVYEATVSLPTGKWETSLTGIQRVAHSLLQRNDELNAQYAMLDKQLVQLQNAISLQKRENIRMGRDLASRQQEVKNNTWIGNLQTKIELKQNEYERKTKDLKDLQQKIENEQRAQQLYQLQYEDVLLQQKSLEEELKAREQYYKAQKVDDQPAIQTLLKEIEQAKQTVEAYQTKLAKLKEEKLPTNEDLVILKQENQALFNKIEEEKANIAEDVRMKNLKIEQQYQENIQKEAFKKQQLNEEIAFLREELVRTEEKRRMHEQRHILALKEQQEKRDQFEEKRQMLIAQKEQRQSEIKASAVKGNTGINIGSGKSLVREMARIDATNQLFQDRIENLRENVAILEQNLSVLRKQHELYEAKRVKAN